MTDRCRFDNAWIGPCGGSTVEDSEYCKIHLGLMCIGCRTKQATRECSETMQFVCGAPLCDDCEHKFDGRIMQHRPKS